MSDTDDLYDSVHDYLAPFPPNAVSQKPGRGSFDYIGHETINLRLIRLTHNNFTWKMVDQRFEEMVGSTQAGGQQLLKVHIFTGELSVPGLGTRVGQGVNVIRDGGGEDQFKAAESDAFKRAAMRFGPGLPLYKPVDFDGSVLTQPNMTQPQQRPPQAPPQRPTPPPPPARPAPPQQAAPPAREPVRIDPPGVAAPAPAPVAPAAPSQPSLAPQRGPTQPGTVERAPGGVPIVRTEQQLRKALEWGKPLQTQKASWGKFLWMACHQKGEEDTQQAWKAVAQLAAGAIKIGGVQEQDWRVQMMASAAPTEDILTSVLDLGVSRGISPDRVGQWVDQRATILKQEREKQEHGNGEEQAPSGA